MQKTLVPLPLSAGPFSLLLPLFLSVSQPVSLLCVCLGCSFPIIPPTSAPASISLGPQASGSELKQTKAKSRSKGSKNTSLVQRPALACPGRLPWMGRAAGGQNPELTRPPKTDSPKIQPRGNHAGRALIDWAKGNYAHSGSSPQEFLST